MSAFVFKFTGCITEGAMQFSELIGQDLRESEKDRWLQLAMLHEVVNKFFNIYSSWITFSRSDSKMAFSINLEISCSPILHTIGLCDLFQCVISHLFPSLIVS